MEATAASTNQNSQQCGSEQQDAALLASLSSKMNGKQLFGGKASFHEGQKTTVSDSTLSTTASLHPSFNDNANGSAVATTARIHHYQPREPTSVRSTSAAEAIETNTSAASSMTASPLVTPPLVASRHTSTSALSALEAVPSILQHHLPEISTMQSRKSKARAPEVATSTSSSAPHPRGVPHVYHDHGTIPDDLHFVRKKTGGVIQPFPEKLHVLLQAAEHDTSISTNVSWLPHGRAFLLHRPKDFARDIMPKLSIYRVLR